MAKRTEKHPSPIRMLAILRAKADGMPLQEISDRTSHSVSTIMRWWNQWADDCSFLSSLFLLEGPAISRRIQISRFYPHQARLPFDNAESTEARPLELAGRNS